MDLSEFYQPKNKSCLFAKVATKLKQDDLEKVEAALLEKDITIASIEKFMQSRGVSARRWVAVPLPRPSARLSNS